MLKAKCFKPYALDLKLPLLATSYSLFTIYYSSLRMVSDLCIPVTSYFKKSFPFCEQTN